MPRIPLDSLAPQMDDNEQSSSASAQLNSSCDKCRSVRRACVAGTQGINGPCKRCSSLGYQCVRAVAKKRGPKGPRKRRHSSEEEERLGGGRGEHFNGEVTERAVVQQDKRTRSSSRSDSADSTAPKPTLAAQLSNIGYLLQQEYKYPTRLDLQQPVPEMAGATAPPELPETFFAAPLSHLTLPIPEPMPPTTWINRVTSVFPEPFSGPWSAGFSPAGGVALNQGATSHFAPNQSWYPDVSYREFAMIPSFADPTGGSAYLEIPRLSLPGAQQTPFNNNNSMERSSSETPASSYDSQFSQLGSAESPYYSSGATPSAGAAAGGQSVGSVSVSSSARVGGVGSVVPATEIRSHGSQNHVFKDN